MRRRVAKDQSSCNVNPRLDGLGGKLGSVDSRPIRRAPCSHCEVHRKVRRPCQSAHRQACNLATQSRNTALEFSPPIPVYYRYHCGSGGTGRRARLRIFWPKGCGGSNRPFRTRMAEKDRPADRLRGTMPPRCIKWSAAFTTSLISTILLPL